MKCANEKLSMFLACQGVEKPSPPIFMAIYARWKMPAMANEKTNIYLLDELWQVLCVVEYHELLVDALRGIATRRVRFVVVIECSQRVIAYYPKNLRGFSHAMVERLWKRSQNEPH